MPRTITAMLLLCILTGCAYRAGYTPSPDGSLRAFATSRGVVQIERTDPDGTKTKVTIDTAQMSSLDRMRAAVANGWEKACAIAGKTTPLIGD